jgi:hypothetical protein
VKVSSKVRALKRASLLCSIVVAAFLWGPLLADSDGSAQREVGFSANRPPTAGTYVGMDSCAKCHSDIATAHKSSGMGRALVLPEHAPILIANPRLSTRIGPFTYQIVRDGSRSVYSVTDGTNTISEPILYVFGQGKAGQTYVYKHAGAYYESRVSYYTEIKGLDVTIGHTKPEPGKDALVDVLGRLTSGDELRECVGCHTTAAVVGKELHFDRLVPGVNCESCHGPGGDHVASMKAGDFKNLKIFNPGKLDGDALTQDFCGKCHRSAETVLFLPQPSGVNNVRFQPYRIFNSKCYSDDKRISCVGCHDPHTSVEMDVKFYDDKCMACHAPKGTSAAALAAKKLEPPCPVGTNTCATCHMPKVPLPGGHMDFTDHRIRIAKPGDPYPN